MRIAVDCLSLRAVAEHLSCRLIWALIFMCCAPVSGQIHPADVDSDGLLSIHEVTAYAKAAAAGAAWASGPSPVTEADAERATFIWRNGERYSLVDGLPVAAGWVPAPLDGTLFATVEDLRPEPLDLLELYGLPVGEEGLVLEYLIEGEAEMHYAPLYPIDTDRWGLLVPYIPGTPGGARDMELWAVSETRRFPIIPLSPVPLPAATGTAAAMSSRLTNVAQLAGAFYGADPALYYDAPPESIPEGLHSLVMVDRVVRDPENPNNLLRVLEGTAPLLAEYGVQMADMDAMFAKLGLLNTLDSLEAILGGTANAALQPAPFMAISSSDGGISQPAALIAIGTLGQLAEAMRKQCAAERYTKPGAEAQVAKDAAGFAAIAVGLAGPFGAVAAASFSVATWAIDTYHLVIANQWPSEVDTFDLIFSPSFSVEDDCEPSSWEATTNARSREWSLDKTVVTGALNLLGANKVRLDWIEAGGKVGLREGFKASFKKGEQTMAEILSAESQMALDKTFPNTSVIPVPASFWSGIQVTDADFGLIEVEYQGDAVKKGATLREVVPQSVGQSIVRVRTLPGALGPCAAMEGGATFYEVLENKVTISPGGGQVKPGEEIEFTATITDADNKSLFFIISHGTRLEETLNPETGVHKLRWKAPSEAEMPETPIQITALSLSSNCLRLNVVREAVATLTPFKQEFILVPSVDCLNPGDEQVFEVRDVHLGEVPPVTWWVIGDGDISPSGSTATYTAGEPGMDTIVATIETASGPVTLEQTVLVGCSLSATLSLNPADGPNLDRTVLTYSAGFIIDGIGLATGDVYMDYTSLTPPAGDNPTGVARGTFAGAGLFYPADPVEEAARIDDSEAIRWYTVTTGDGIQLQYAVQVDFGLDLFDQEEREVLLQDGRDGANLQIRLAASAIAGSLTDFENEIVAYNWTFSDGDNASSEVVNKAVSRDLSSLTITLEVMDRLGNSARYSETLFIVRMSGTFAFPYEPGGVLTAALPWNLPFDPPPPEFNGDAYAVFVTDPAACFIEVSLTGSRSTSVSADSSTAGIVQDEEFSIYNIGFFSTGGF